MISRKDPQISKRNDIWLLSRLDHIWSNHFKDVSQINPVHIKFGRFSRLRLGSIKMERGSNRSYITITSMFKDERVPQEVIDHTIAHELCHYAHGFSSPKQRLHRHPHHGGIVDKEMVSRGLGKEIKAYKEWVKSYRLDLRNMIKD